MTMQRRLPPEVKERLLEALKTGMEKGYGYYKIWRMLKESGIEVSSSIVGYYYYKSFPERVKKREKGLSRELRIKLYQKVLELRRQGLGYRTIAKKLKELYGVSPSPYAISTWCRKICTP